VEVWLSSRLTCSLVFLGSSGLGRFPLRSKRIFPYFRTWYPQARHALESAYGSDSQLQRARILPYGRPKEHAKLAYRKTLGQQRHLQIAQIAPNRFTVGESHQMI